ncbi:ATP-grasp domain-containing protein [Streptomyces sp. AJS327]|uniref:acetyl/propionyl/methylcrotonyl-CoA carboxylase subunit alpha n=1 Tax=Streptomyces sp. AJS327 TaxID=2545265 RepID=UPI0015DF3693|nr:biotin carboxylase N-terminal domain-containing protein [Streptomyces sp. AJS327]MBA0053249.1 ATP-grasp domain-containing protein [Streptomyces sp. AJS327]
MIGSVLVANRGEIARRILRTCAALGVETVAVYSDADAGAPHVREADRAVRLPGDAPADTYLRGDLLVAAARSAGADAVHPGYGFLSESAEFATAVREAGLCWIGPPPEAISAMASKTRAKRLMRDAGVPLLEPVEADAAVEADLPLLVKAASGGGGRGMRVVRRLDALRDEVAAARREAEAAFGDGEVFVEPYVERGRHVEVQILADRHGTVWVLGTRDCSLQRRHQKVIEEAPAPELPASLREELHRAAERAARAVEYEGAGTVEFLVRAPGTGAPGHGGEGAPEDGSGAYFLEMNTRLQVEHPVTEYVFGVDLVAEQIRVAEGAALDPAGPGPAEGHAVEARLYAEDPARDWRPQTGAVHRLEVPGADRNGGPTSPRDRGVGRPGGLRLDSGVEAGDEVGTHYDPMLAKVVSWAPTRAEAVRRLAHALERARVHGPVTNRELLVRSLRHPDFRAARLDTGFYDRHLAALTDREEVAAAGPNTRDQEGGSGDPAALSALAAALADAAARTGGPGVAARLGGWRNLVSQPQTKRYRREPDGVEREIRYRLTRDGLHAPDFPGVRLVGATPHRVTLDVRGVLHTVEVSVYGTGGAPCGGSPGARRPTRHGAEPGYFGRRVHVDSALGSHTFTALPLLPEPEDTTEAGSLLAPMPGAVVRVADGLAPGVAVVEGQPLLWLEAMKMEHRVAAPTSGVLTDLRVRPGSQVELGTVLAVVSPGTETAVNGGDDSGTAGADPTGGGDGDPADAGSTAGGHGA